MKQKMKPFIKILILSFFITLFTGCSEDVYETKNNNSQKLKYRFLNVNELKNNLLVLNKLQEVEQKNSLAKNQKSSKTTERLVYLNEYNFTIDTDNILMVENGDYKTYTFAIYRDEETNKTENLVITEHYNVINTYISKYTLTEFEKQKIGNFEYVDLSHKTEISKLENVINTEEGPCYEFIRVESFENEEGGITHSFIMIVEAPCPDGGGSSGGGGDSSGGGSFGGSWGSGWSGGSSWGSGDWTGGSGSGGGGDSSGNNSNDESSLNYGDNQIITTPILTTENSEDIKNASRFYNTLTIAQQNWTQQNQTAYYQVLDYLKNENWSDESKVFAEELMDTSIQLEINVIDIWFNDYENFRNQMSNSERAIFDNILPNRQMWYMASAYKALEKSNELFPNTFIPSNSHNGKGDAFRHALWNAYFTGFCGATLAEQLTTAHEDNIDPNNPFPQKEIEMDLYNNQKGRLIASYSNVSNVTQNVLDYLNAGGLRYLNALNPNPPYYPTFYSTLIPTDQ